MEEKGGFNLKKFLFGKINHKIFFSFLIIILFIGIIAGVGSFYMDKMTKAENYEEATKLAKTTQFIMISITLITFFLAIILGIVIPKKISSPLKELQNATEQVERRNFQVRVDIKTGDELEQLGDSFNKTTEALQKMDEEYKKLDRAKTEFLSITSHELRSPMTPMKAQLQMLIEEYFGKINPKQKEALEIVSRNTTRLDSIILDFLEISRIEAARLKFRFVKKDLIPYITRLVEEMEGFLPEKKIKIITKISKLPIIELDPDRIMQVLRNLVNNAKKFSNVNTTIEISAKLSDNMILFGVKDQGVGIKPEQQRKIFEPFFQGEQTMYREKGGTGLGLAICRGIVESQNGKIWAESKVGKGSTFYFTVPLKPVTEIKPIKLLFSTKKDTEEKIKEIFKEILGPMGNKEFETLKNKLNINKKDLTEYVNILVKKSIINEEKEQLFKSKILNIFGEKLKGIDSESLKKAGLITSPTKKVGVEDIIKKKEVK